MSLNLDLLRSKNMSKDLLIFNILSFLFSWKVRRGESLFGVHMYTEGK